jgi:hypothetical protein
VSNLRKPRGFLGDIAGAWRALDVDLSGSITLQEIDKEWLGTWENHGKVMGHPLFLSKIGKVVGM